MNNIIIQQYIFKLELRLNLRATVKANSETYTKLSSPSSPDSKLILQKFVHLMLKVVSTRLPEETEARLPRLARRLGKFQG